MISSLASAVVSVKDTALYSYLDLLKWPIVATLFGIIIIVKFQRQIRHYLGNVTEFNALGVKSKATKDIQQQQQNSNPFEFNNLQKAIAFFSTEVISHYKKFVLDESELKLQNTDAEKIEALINYSCVIYIKATFDGFYEIIFGSQIKILLHLNSLRGTGDSKNNIKRYYDEAVEKAGKDIYTIAFDDYLYFLFKALLIVEKDGKVQLTHQGLDFVKFLAETGKNLEKPL